jgi:CheY-like chemotaxis protein
MVSVVPRSVLIVDPDLNGNKLATLVLKQDGWVVITATSASEAHTALATFMPSLVVTELRLPDSDGISLVASLRRSPSTSHLPVVAMTSSTGPEVELDTRAAGCVDYIRKPIDVMTFSDQLGHALVAQP